MVAMPYVNDFITHKRQELESSQGSIILGNDGCYKIQKAPSGLTGNLPNYHSVWMLQKRETVQWTISFKVL